MEILMKMIVFVALLAAAGCGSKKTGPDCEAAISKAMENLAPKVKSGATDPQIQESKLARFDKFRAALMQRCIMDKWAPEVLACFHTVANLTVMTVCQDKLPSEQRTKLKADLREVEKGIMGERMSGGMAGHPEPPGAEAPGGSAAAPAGAAADPAAAAPAPAGSAAPEPAGGSSATGSNAK